MSLTNVSACMLPPVEALLSLPNELPTPTRAELNRENAQRSTGPKTDEGKSRVRFNALKSGIYSKEVLLPREDAAAYEALGRSLTDFWAPESPEEVELVEAIRDARWRLRRILARETALTALTAEQHRAAIEEKFEADPETLDQLAQAAGFQANYRLFGQLNRHEARLERLIDAATKKLTVIAHARAARAASPAAPAPACPAPIPSSSPSGFVPSLSTTPAFPADMPAFHGPHAADKKRTWLRKHGHYALANLVR